MKTLATSIKIILSLGGLLCLITSFSTAQSPLPLPFREDFESGKWNGNFATNNFPTGIVEVTDLYDPIGVFHLVTYSIANNKKAYNQIDMHLDMTGAMRDIFFRFFAKNLDPNIQPSVLLLFSDDRGNHYTKLINPTQPSRFVTIQNWQHNWKIYTVNMTDLIRPYGLFFNHHCVIRMEVTTQYQTPRGGMAFDNISVQEEMVIETGELPEHNYDLPELEFIDIQDCGRLDCPPIFDFDEGPLDKNFWSLHEGKNGKAFLEQSETGYHVRLNTLPNETGYAVSAATLRFDASPWPSTDPDVDPAIALKFNWKSDVGYLTPYDAVYISDNSGETYAKIYNFSENNQNPGQWQEITLNLSEQVSAHSLKFSDRFVIVFQHFNDLVAGSLGYALDNVKVGVQEPNGDPAYLRSYNYPNPFSFETSVAFELEAESDVHLKILDSQGRVIQAVTEKNMPTGRHTLPWDGKDSVGKTAQPGIYFYILETAQGVEIRRIWLEK